MNGTELILAIDQGTTSSRAIVFDSQVNIVSVAQQEFPQHYPNDGWVEHAPEDLWNSTLAVARQAMAEAEQKGGQVVAFGLTNQRETTLVWERATGKPVFNAIVWQDRRTAGLCQQLRDQGLEAAVQSKTGLLLDAYFSATKVAWILDHVEGARARAEKGELAFGTVDSFIISRLTGGRSHVIDATNASRTNLYNIHSGTWDPELLEMFNVPESMLPEVLDCSANFGQTEASLFGRTIPILGVAGDQQSAAIGQGCFEKGSIKSTYGTGCFALLNTGQDAVASHNRLLTTVAYQLQGRRTYALEGSIFIAGAAVQWLRDGLGIIQRAAETQTLAAGIPSNEGVYMVPAFTGLGAPYWDSEARGAVFGLTRATGSAELARAALESVCYQTHDLLSAMATDAGMPARLRVDGGMAANDWLMAFLADVLDLPIDRPQVVETTALGAAFLAGSKAGVYGSLEEIASNWKCERTFQPQMSQHHRQQLLAGWADAVSRVVGRNA